MFEWWRLVPAFLTQACLQTFYRCERSAMSANNFPAPNPELLEKIKAVVGPSGWKDAVDGARYFEDPRGRFTGHGRLIVLPRTTREVAEIVRLCHDAGAGIVPYGGGTGVVAGQLSIDSGEAIIVSLENMDAIRKVSVDDGVMVVEAGCILENVHAAAGEYGMVFPLSMASKGSCCIGGNLATNAGGIQVLRYGNARDLCLGIEAVLPDGSILDELSPVRKNNTGYDLRHLLIGSEGTLGIITAATLKLSPIDEESGTAFLALSRPADGFEVYRTLREHLGQSVSALELMSGFGLQLVSARFPDLRMPFENCPEWALLCEASGSAGISGQIELALGECLEKGLIGDAIIAQSQSQRLAFWELRERTPEANRLEGAFCSSDTAVPLSRIESFILATVEAVASIHPDIRINSYGHFGDGNIHHNVFPPAGVAKSDFLSAHPGIVEAVRMAINEVTHANGGSISAEHGIGRLKTEDMTMFTSPTRRAVLRQIKSALDPKNIMNPGALLR